MNCYVETHEFVHFLVLKSQHVCIIGRIIQIWICRYWLSPLVNSNTNQSFGGAKIKYTHTQTHPIFSLFKKKEKENKAIYL
jgi:hypothetical protein